MAKKKSARATRASAKVGTSGFHTSFGPIADPGPDGFGPGHWGGGHWGGGHWGGGLGHFGPVADPGPVFDGLRGLDRAALDPAAVKELQALRLRSLDATIASLKEQGAIADEAFKVLSRMPDKLRMDQLRIPWHIDPGDPAPELEPIDILRYVHELRASALRRTLEFLGEARKALRAAK